MFDVNFLSAGRHNDIISTKGWLRSFRGEYPGRVNGRMLSGTFALILSGRQGKITPRRRWTPEQAAVSVTHADKNAILILPNLEKFKIPPSILLDVLN
ncbi:MAG: hypothetical protein II596_09025, partial [Thermoguttaceae bacterium]|nr:hypothetical protein [Thermoguttaceae bacterium]